MPTIKVEFPDGPRDVPAEQRIRKSREIRGTDQVELVPKFDPDWRFTAVIGGWRAARRDR
jgi:hypothetical protein